jgi:hypothetical protein
METCSLPDSTGADLALTTTFYCGQQLGNALSQPPSQNILLDAIWDHLRSLVKKPLYLITLPIIDPIIDVYIRIKECMVMLETLTPHPVGGYFEEKNCTDLPKLC